MTEASSRLAIFTQGVQAAMAPTPPLLPASMPLGEALARLAAEGQSSLIALDPAGGLAGILTEQDIARRVAFRLAPDQPVAAAITAPVLTVHADEHLYRAVGLMRQHHLRHMPVVDADGRPVGMLHLHEALAAASARLIGHIDSLAQDDSLEGFAATKRAQAGLARALLEDGVAATEIIGLVTEVNHDIHRKVLAGLIAEREAAGLGAPPVPFTLLIMGSGGRGESFLFPDQDNGFVLGPYPDDEHGRIDAWFRDFADEFNQRLDRVGFPLCKGHVMARNPLWRKTLDQWRGQFALWIERRSPTAVLFADIAFDFRSVWGPAEPVALLRAELSAALKRKPALLAIIAGDDARLTVPLGFWGGIQTEGAGEHEGRADLKLHGTMPLVAAVRLLALREGVAETGTLDRLAALTARGVVPEAQAAGLRLAFAVLVGALLRQQLDDFEAGQKVGNWVEVKRLSRTQQGVLRDALKAIGGFAKETRAAFTGQLW